MKRQYLRHKLKVESCSKKKQFVFHSKKVLVLKVDARNSSISFYGGKLCAGKWWRCPRLLLRHRSQLNVRVLNWGERGSDDQRAD